MTVDLKSLRIAADDPHFRSVLLQEGHHKQALKILEDELQRKLEHGANPEITNIKREFSDMLNSFASTLLAQKPMPKGSLQEVKDMLNKASDLLKHDDAANAINHKVTTLLNSASACAKMNEHERAVTHARGAVTLLEHKQESIGEVGLGYNVIHEREDKEMLASAYYTLGNRYKACACFFTRVPNLCAEKMLSHQSNAADTFSKGFQFAQKNLVKLHSLTEKLELALGHQIARNSKALAGANSAYNDAVDISRKAANFALYIAEVRK